MRAEEVDVLTGISDLNPQKKIKEGTCNRNAVWWEGDREYQCVLTKGERKLISCLSEKGQHMLISARLLSAKTCFVDGFIMKAASFFLDKWIVNLAT